VASWRPIDLASRALAALGAVLRRRRRPRSVVRHEASRHRPYFVPDVVEVPAPPARRRALLLYLVEPFVLPEGDPAWLKHSNLGRARRIAQALAEHGYAVDVANSRDRRFGPEREYDLVISDRASLRPEVDRRLGESTRVFLATSDNYVEHNRKLRLRHRRLEARRGYGVPVTRLYRESMPFLAGCAAIVAVGNRYTAQSWSDAFGGPIHRIDNHGLPGIEPALGAKDFARAGRHFLHFASRSQVQKGLDLLLEVFPRHPGLHLWVCSAFRGEPEFCRCYRRELFRTANVHPVGWIPVGGRRFRELTVRCAHVILPSCSEGQAGSVVQCMHAGLIPLVTREAGIDSDGFGTTFRDDSIDEIERGVLEAAASPAALLRARAEATLEAARAQYTEAALVANLYTILNDLRASGAPRRGGEPPGELHAARASG